MPSAGTAGSVRRRRPAALLDGRPAVLEHLGVVVEGLGQRALGGHIAHQVVGLLAGVVSVVGGIAPCRTANRGDSRSRAEVEDAQRGGCFLMGFVAGPAPLGGGVGP